MTVNYYNEGNICKTKKCVHYCHGGGSGGGIVMVMAVIITIMSVNVECWCVPV